MDAMDAACATGAINSADDCLGAIGRKAAELRAAVDATRQRRGSHLVDLQALGRRTKCIDELADLCTGLRDLTAEVEHHLAAARLLHSAEITTLHSAIGGGGASPWADPARTAMIGRSEGVRARPGVGQGRPPKALGPLPGLPTPQTAIVRRVARPKSSPARPAKKLCTRVRLAGGSSGLELDAVVVPNHLASPSAIFGAIVTSELHFIPQWGHFAARVGATVFHAGLGDVLSPDEKPVRVKDCRRGARCPSLGRADVACNYYHNPELCPGSRDVRNFGPYDRLYAPLTRESQMAVDPRRFGSGRDATSDLERVGKRDARRFKEQVAHDMLCVLLLEKYAGRD